MTEMAFKRQFVASWLAGYALQRNFIRREHWPIRRALHLAELAYRDLVRTEDTIAKGKKPARA